MSLSLYANRRRSNKGPFIHTQRLLFLQASANQRKACLEPARFPRRTACRGNKGEPGQPELPPDSRWRRVKDRERFLTRVTRPRLCLLVDAGVGKTCTATCGDGRVAGTQTIQKKGVVPNPAARSARVAWRVCGAASQTTVVVRTATTMCREHRPQRGFSGVSRRRSSS